MRVRSGMRLAQLGEILAEELEELGLSANPLGVPTSRITAILKGQRGVTAVRVQPREPVQVVGPEERLAAQG